MSAEFELHEGQRQLFAPAYFQLTELTKCLKGGLKLGSGRDAQRLYYWHEGTGFGMAYFNGRGLCFNMNINREGVQEIGVLRWSDKTDFRVEKIIHFDHPDREIDGLEIVAGREVKQGWDFATVKLIDKFVNSFLAGEAQVYVPQS